MFLVPSSFPPSDVVASSFHCYVLLYPTVPSLAHAHAHAFTAAPLLLIDRRPLSLSLLADSCGLANSTQHPVISRVAPDHHSRIWAKHT